MYSTRRPSSPVIALAILIGAILLVTAIPAVLYFPAHRFLLSPDAVTEEILSSDLSARLPDLVAGWLQDGTIQLQGGAMLSALDREDYDAILAQLAPADWLKIQSAVIARQAQDYFLGKTDALTITLDLTEVGQRLSGDAAPAIAGIIVSSWEECTAAKLVELGLAAAAGSPLADLPLCRPSDALQPFVTQAVEGGLQQLATQIPANASFDLATADSVGQRVQWIRLAARWWGWMPWLSILMALLIFWVLGKSLRYGLLGIGLPLCLAGIIDAGLALASAALRNSNLSPWLDEQLALYMPAGLAELVTPALVNVFGRFCLSALVWSAAATLLGAALVIVSRIIPRNAGQ